MSNSGKKFNVLMLISLLLGLLMVSRAYASELPLPTNRRVERNPSATVRVGTYEIEPISSVNVPITASIPASSELGGATIELHFDSSVAQVLSCVIDPALTGFCNTDYNEGALLFNAVSLSGVTGELTLAEIEFQAVGQVGDQTTLDVNVQAFGDTKTNPIAVSDVDGELNMVSGANAPLLTAITPNRAATNAGNVPVVIEGAYFKEPMRAEMDGVALSNVTLVTTTTLEAVVPVASLGEGVYELTVEHGGERVSLPDAFTVSAPVAETQFLAMIYMACDNNLDSYCHTLFNNLELALLNHPDLRIVAFWDGQQEGDSGYYLVQPDNDAHRWASYDESNRVLLGEVDSADANTLVEFADWSQSQYPSHYTFLSLVGHGDGWAPNRRVGQLLSRDNNDQLGGYWWGAGGMLSDDHSQQVMKTLALKDAIATISAANQIDVIYLDACLMGAVEVMAELSPYADYMVAHENITWTIYPYDQYFHSIDGTTTPETLALQIAEANHESWPERGHPSQISVIKTSEIDDLLTKLDALALELSAILPTQRATIYQVVQNSAHVNENIDEELGRDDWLINMEDSGIDLSHFATELKSHLDIAEPVKRAAQELLTALDRVIMVNHTKSGTPHPGSESWDLSNLHGLSIYFPLNDEAKRLKYGANALPRFASETSWDEFIQSWHEERMPMLTIDKPESVPVGERIWITVSLRDMDQTDDVRGVQASVQVTETQILRLADNLFFDMLANIMRSSSNGWDIEFHVEDYGFNFLLTSSVSIFETVDGTGLIVEFPFYFEEEGCANLEFSEHILMNSTANEIEHQQTGALICTDNSSILSGKTYLQAQAEGAHDEILVTLKNSTRTYTTTTDLNGHYRFIGIRQGTYVMTFTDLAPVPIFTQRVVSDVEVNHKEITMPDVGLWAGDVDQDNEVDQRDLHLLKAALIPVNFLGFDINADGIIDVEDSIILEDNMGQENITTTSPPRGNLYHRVAESEDLARSVIVSDMAQPFTLPAQAGGNWVYTLRAEQVDGTLQSVGARFGLPAGATVTNVEAIGRFVGGYLEAQQIEDKLYIVAAPPEDALLTQDSDVVRIHATLSSEEAITVNMEAWNQVGWSGDLVVAEAEMIRYSFYLPIIQR